MKNLNSGDYRKFQKLNSNRAFNQWREIVDEFQVERAHNYLKGMKVPEDIKNPHDYYRGGYDLWQKALRVIDRAEDMLSELDSDKDVQ